MIPTIYASVVAIAFLFIAFAYTFYDVIVENRNKQLVETAARSNEIVTSLFPSHLRDQLIGTPSSPDENKKRNLKALLRRLQLRTSGRSVFGDHHFVCR